MAWPYHELQPWHVSDTRLAASVYGAISDHYVVVGPQTPPGRESATALYAYETLFHGFDPPRIIANPPRNAGVWTEPFPELCEAYACCVAKDMCTVQPDPLWD